MCASKACFARFEFECNARNSWPLPQEAYNVLDYYSNQIKSNQISFISGNMAHKKKVTNSEKDRQKDRHKTYKHTV